MIKLLRGVVSTLMLFGPLGLVASGENDNTLQQYRQALELSRPNVVCANGSVEQRLDCLGRQISELSRRVEEPRVVPLGDSERPVR
jgi:hypothetical protein